MTVYAVSYPKKTEDIGGFPIFGKEEAQKRGADSDLEKMDGVNLRVNVTFLDELKDLFTGYFKGTGVSSARRKALRIIRKEALKMGYNSAILCYEGAFFQDPMGRETPMIHDNDPNVYTCQARFFNQTSN